MGVIIHFTHLTGEAVVKGRIRTYINATGELDNRRDPLTLGTRVLLTFDVTGLPENSASVKYRWYYNCIVAHNKSCEIRGRDLHYRVVNDTLGGCHFLRQRREVPM